MAEERQSSPLPETAHPALQASQTKRQKGGKEKFNPLKD